jgi:adenosine deaminase
LIDLHRHLEGSVRFETLVELARDVGLGLSRSELRRRTSMKGEKPGFLRFLSKFQVYRGLYPSRDWIERVAFEAAEDAKHEGVRYLELRFSPTHFGRRMGAAGEDVAEWVARGARRAGIGISFIATFGRDFGVKGNEPTTRAVRGTRVFSGLDLAGTEAVPAAPFVPLFRKLQLPATIHAGEARGPENVREAMDRFGAKRIGHGVRILGDRELVRRAVREGVVFETCPTSELQTGAAKAGRRHPIARMKDAGLKITINTDDPSVCGTSLRAEFGAAKKMGFTDGELRRTLLEAAMAAFVPDSQRRKLLAPLSAVE